MAKYENGTVPLSGGNSTVHSIVRRHTSYVSISGIISCYLTEEFKFQYPTACEFVINTKSCHGVVNMLNYLKFLTCTANLNANLLILFIMLGILMILFTYLFVITKYFILPNIIHLARYMKLPLYDYGFAIVPMIILGPDIVWVFHYCTLVTKINTLEFADLVGNSFATFISGIGTLCVCGCEAFPGWRGLCQLLCAFVVFLADYLVLRRRLATLVRKDIPELDTYPYAFTMLAIYVFYIAYAIVTKNLAHRRTPVDHRLGQSSILIGQHTGWSQLSYALNPFKHIKFQRWKVVLLIPFWTVACLQIPVVDTSRYLFGWSKYLFCLNFVIFPVVMHFGYSFNFPFYSLVVSAICLVVLIVTIAMTRPHSPPRFLGLYAVFGILIGTYSICVIEGEIETVFWQTLSFVFNAPLDTIILTGFTLRAIVLLVVLTHGLVYAGLHDLACGVVVGVIISRVFMLMPILTFQKCFKYDFPLAESASTTTCIIFFSIAWIITLMLIPMYGFRPRPALGYFLIAFYVLYYIYLIFEALSFIHTFGTFHAIGGELMMAHSSWA